MSDREQPFLDLKHEVSEHIEDQAARHGTRRDFAAVVARAHSIDSSRISPDMVDRAAEFAPVVAIDRERTVSGELDPRLEALFADVRMHIDAQVEERRLGGIPPFARRRSRRRLGSWIAGAAALLVLGVLGLLEVVRMRGGEQPVGYDQALRSEDEKTAPKRATVHALGPPRTPAPNAAAETGMGTGAELTAADGTGSELPQRSERMQRSPKKSLKTASIESSSAAAIDANLRALDDEARAAWRRGDVRTAERVFTEIVRVGGTHPLVELAYGDLFTIAHESNARERVSLWRAYLSRFPRGRFKDDARAGLCRHAEDTERAQCWRNYLDEMSEGAHRNEAMRWTTSMPPNPAP